MKTHYFNPGQIADAAALLRAGGIVAFPTETVYGLGASIWDEEAIRKIYIAKGRPEDNPLIAHVATLDGAKKCAETLPDSFFALAEAFWPGPLSIVVKKNPLVPSIASAGLDSIAIRMPREEIALKLIELAGAPLVAPSANRSGFPSATCPKHVQDDFEGVIDGIIVGQPSQVGIESTVISLLDPLNPVLLRSGIISIAELEMVLKRPILIAPKNTSVPLSPGMKYRHYSPNTPVFLFDDLAYFQNGCEWAFETNQKCAIFCDLKSCASFLKKFSQKGKSLHFLGNLTPSTLYQALRDLDTKLFDCAMILSSKEDLIWQRLTSATAGVINPILSLETVQAHT